MCGLLFRHFIVVAVFADPRDRVFGSCRNINIRNFFVLMFCEVCGQVFGEVCSFEFNHVSIVPEFPDLSFLSQKPQSSEVLVGGCNGIELVDVCWYDPGVFVVFVWVDRDVV